MKRLHSDEADRTDYIVGPFTLMSYPRFKALLFRDVCSLEFMWSGRVYRSWDLTFNLFDKADHE